MSFTTDAIHGEELLIVDKDDHRLASEQYSEAASRTACSRAREPRTAEQQHEVDLENERWQLVCRLDHQYYRNARSPLEPVLIERDGRALHLYDRMRLSWCSTPDVGFRFTMQEALALQVEFPMYLANTTVRSLKPCAPSIEICSSAWPPHSRPRRSRAVARPAARSST